MEVEKIRDCDTCIHAISTTTVEEGTSPDNLFYFPDTFCNAGETPDLPAPCQREESKSMP